MAFAAVMVSVQPPWLFTWEGVVAGFFSSFFAAAEPVLLVLTYKKLLAYHSPQGYGHPNPSIMGPGTTTFQFHGDGHAQPRAHYHLLHYTTVLSALLTLPWVFISGEAGSIQRNCYILDIPWFWLMIVLGGLAAYSSFLAFWMLVRTTSPLTGNLVVQGLGVTVQAVVLGGRGMQEWGWMGAMTGWGAGVWYLLGRRRECGVSLWGGGPEGGDEVLWDGGEGEGRRRSGESEEEFLVG